MYAACAVAKPTRLQGIMELGDLASELQERVRACTSSEDVLRLAKKEGYELSDDELASVAGGDGFWEYCEGYQHCYHF